MKNTEQKEDVFTGLLREKYAEMERQLEEAVTAAALAGIEKNKADSEVQWLAEQRNALWKLLPQKL